jgi:homoserine O-acetyltransferase
MSIPAIFRHSASFTLECGITIPGYHLAYHTYGTLKENNVVWIFHALTANSDPTDWWPGLVGEGKLFDPSKYFIVCVNMPGSCYGSVGPLEQIQGSREFYYHAFPFFTTRDMIRAYQPLKQQLGISKIHIGIGGSMGGQQLLEWAIEEPALFEHIIPIATNAWHSPWGKAFNESQRWCIESDPGWKKRSPDAGLEGMKLARSVALLSYRHYQTYDLFQNDENTGSLSNYKAASYQQYQGEKLAKRFNAFSYYALLRSMDSHHVGRHRKDAATALQQITAAALVIGLTSDILFPLSEQKYLATHIPNAKYAEIDSVYGHDGFLLEYEAIEKEIMQFLKNNNTYNKAALPAHTE